MATRFNFISWITKSESDSDFLKWKWSWFPTSEICDTSEITTSDFLRFGGLIKLIPMKNLITRYANLDTWIYCCTHIVFMEFILIRSLLNNCFLWKATMVTIKIEILSDDTNGFDHPMISFYLWKFFAKLWIAPDHRTLHIHTTPSLPVRFCFVPTSLGWGVLLFWGVDEKAWFEHPAKNYIDSLAWSELNRLNADVYSVFIDQYVKESWRKVVKHNDVITSDHRKFWFRPSQVSLTPLAFLTVLLNCNHLHSPFKTSIDWGEPVRGNTGQRNACPSHLIRRWMRIVSLLKFIGLLSRGRFQLQLTAWRGDVSIKRLVATVLILLGENQIHEPKSMKIMFSFYFFHVHWT